MHDVTIWSKRIVMILRCSFVAVLIVLAGTEVRSQTQSAAQKTPASRMPPSAGFISGTVLSARGPEAGVWVIAETGDLGTKYRKIVVTDDQGKYLIPDLPKANYKVWVRGYGLVDSSPVAGAPGDTVALAAVVAPTARAAAQVYPPDYWYSLMKVPAKSEFPLTGTNPPPGTGESSLDASGHPQTASSGGSTFTIKSQADYIWGLKRGCEVCHQMGEKMTREIPASIGKFDSTRDAWTRLLRSGQIGYEHFDALKSFGFDRGLDMLSDWSDRIAKGELPPTPPRPQGVERNIVLTVWDFSVPTGFPHDTTTTMRQKPTENAYGPIYSPDWAAGALAVLDPATNEKYMLNVPLPNEADRPKFPTFSNTQVDYPSPYWGNEVVRRDNINAGPTMMDSKGRIWFNVQTRLDIPSFCKAGSNNPFAKNFPTKDQESLAQVRNQAAGINFYDPKAGKFTAIDTCFGVSHVAFGYDKDETLYVTARRLQGIGWVKARVWDETHDMEKSQGWCPAVIDYNGDGKTGAFTMPNEPPNPKLDRYIGGSTGYIDMVNPVDGSVWYTSLDVPGMIVRMTIGDNPPSTCMTEVYQAPFDVKDKGKQEYYSPEGIDIDSKGVVWAALAGSGQLASFDRSKCKVLNGPTATGQHCPEGWTMYQIPGPKFKGTDLIADFSYNSWVDRYDTFGMGKDVSVVSGTGSDSLEVFLPQTKKWVMLRVPYPMGFYTRSLEGRIDDPKIGWKGRGLWGANETRVPWQEEGEKGKTPFVVHFQIRPDPLAR